MENINKTIDNYSFFDAAANINFSFVANMPSIQRESIEKYISKALNSEAFKQKFNFGIIKNKDNHIHLSVSEDDSGYYLLEGRINFNVELFNHDTELDTSPEVREGKLEITIIHELAHALHSIELGADDYILNFKNTHASCSEYTNLEEEFIIKEIEKNYIEQDEHLSKLFVARGTHQRFVITKAEYDTLENKKQYRLPSPFRENDNQDIDSVSSESDSANDYK
ncbi:hypothetical protein [Cysteiniphilum sp. JM-1]|uniref:hypothetical protein n=1 Tax=Cysteiniphilum sp. JM-1 TaxID=2610891 RepID=UPI001245C8D7|nr:hypothetical protein [Cysteiniphilum sp. JM-1]